MAYYKQVFEAVDVMQLPPFHYASRCEHSDRFRRMYEEARRDFAWDHRDEQEVGRRFMQTLSADDRASCFFHQADWVAIADESVRIIHELGEGNRWIYAEAARDSSLDGQDRRWLASLFEYPLMVEGNSYGDGQHRGCALRFSGAAQVAAVVRTELAEKR